MDFVRFTGEWFIYYALIALGGGVLIGLTAGIFEPIGVDVEHDRRWVLPSGAAGAVVVAAWLVEAKQSVIENMAPVLTSVFTPLFAVMLVARRRRYAVTGLGDASTATCSSSSTCCWSWSSALVLYGISAREPSAPPGWMDRIQLVAVVSALVLDLMVLGAMFARIGDLGFTPNRTAALGLNLVLLVNLVWAAWLSAGSSGAGAAFHRLERWQTTYLPVSPCGQPWWWSSPAAVRLRLITGAAPRASRAEGRAGLLPRRGRRSVGVPVPAGSNRPGRANRGISVGEDDLLTDENGESDAISMEDYAMAVLDEADEPRHVGRRFTVAY